MSSSPQLLPFDPYFGRRAEMPLSAWFFGHFRDTYLGLASPATRALYETALRKFLAMEGDLPLSSFVPPGGVTLLARFRDGLLRDGKARPATAAKHLRTFKRILAKAGPGDPRLGDDCFGILPSVAGVRAPRVRRTDPRTVAAEEWIRCYVACEVATKPALPRLTACDWWRGAMVLSVALGPRSGTVERIRVEDLDLSSQGASVRFRPGDKTDRDRRKALRPELLETLTRLLVHGLPYLLAWPHRHGRRRSGEQCTAAGCHAIRCGRGREFARIQRAAGIEDPFTFHDLRRTAGTHKALDEGLRAAADMLDHGGVATTRGYYVPEQVIAGEIGNLAAVALLRAAQARVSRQKTLFD